MGVYHRTIDDHRYAVTAWGVVPISDSGNPPDEPDFDPDPKRLERIRQAAKAKLTDHYGRNDQ